MTFFMRCLLVPIMLAGAAAVVVMGCASTQDLATGSVQGRYMLSSVEKNWNCGGLENALNARITAITALSQQAKAHAETTAPTVLTFFNRMAGTPSEYDTALAQIKTERAAAEAYNASLSAKGCPKVDIDGKLAALGVGRSV